MGPRLLRLLEPGHRPQPANWYRLSPRGDGPRGRVGHGCLFLPGDGSGRSHRWTTAEWNGLRPRYEHATFLSVAVRPRLWVFGGAHPAGNRSCVQVLDLEIGTWESPEVSGVQPLPRTFHTSSAAIGDCLYVFGGGDKGAEPVKDQRLHVFDTATLAWSQPDTDEEPPSPRHGHIMAAVGTKLFIHGGLAGDIFYNDLFCIDINDMKWVKIPATGDIPGGRASHSSAVFKDHLYIFGGIGPEGALDTTYKYHTEKQQWTLLQFNSPLPAGRLDHAMCIIPWLTGKSRDRKGGAWEDKAGTEMAVATADEAGPGWKGECAEDSVMHLLLVFGGMDTQGEIFKDCVVSLIE
ncbi:RABEK protein, partial [Psilopogon haemacephalus]|nr:RABEK protein [Psilopogon haemacephalus]